MMYKILNKLFGWDYIHWDNFADQGIARVRVSRDGTVYYWRYKNTRVLDYIDDNKRITWLTCKREKYFD